MYSEIKDTLTWGYREVRNNALTYVHARKIGDTPGRYEKEEGGGESFYGSYHAAHILDMFGELAHYDEGSLDEWAAYFNERQSEEGFFASSPALRSAKVTLDDLEPVWHYTRGNIWALRILNRKAANDFHFIEPLLDSDALYRWVKKYDWSNSWAAGNQVLACATALFAARDWFGVDVVDTVMEHGMYPALEELLDEQTGFWGTQFGADLPNGLFGTIHVTPIYFAQGWPLRALDRNVDSTLSCQLADGSFWPGGSDCPDYDGAYMMANLAELTNYRREDLEAAARKFLSHVLQHRDPEGMGWLLHRKDSTPEQWRSRPHWIWKRGASRAEAEYRDDDPNRRRIMLGSWFYPLSIALITHILGDTGFEGPYKLNPTSLHMCNVFA